MSSRHIFAAIPSCKAIIPLPASMAGPMAAGIKAQGKYYKPTEYYAAKATGTLFESRWTDAIGYRAVYCKEHSRYELVPSLNYDNDLSYWYDADLHPRFSIVGAYHEAKQRVGECWRIGRVDGGGQGLEFRKVLHASKTKKQFLKNIHPYLFANLYRGGRRIRVTNRFKEKLLARDFTVEDFFAERNQELRRFMLRIIPIQKVTEKMTLIAEDEEGKIYETKGDERRRYLFVKCPSTGQEYLLGIPTQIGNWKEQRPLTSPKEARRWTFNLPLDAEFAKEA